jgi:hypothetical protein
VAPFSWSLSRHSTFASCRRRYYYAYYAAHDDPEIKRLKALSALPLWAGSVVHETIEQFLRTADALPSETGQEALIREAVHVRMVGDWRDSEAGSDRFRLFEHEYAVPVEQEDKKIDVGTVIRSLRHFFHSTTLRDALEAGVAARLSLEDLCSFHVEDVEVLLRMDLAFRRTDGRVVIADWKTGRSEGRLNEIQLAGYALYAAEQGWVTRPEEIETQLVYLSQQRAVVRGVDASTLARARAFVLRSAAEMRGLLSDPLANTAREEAFGRVDQPQVCRRCNFRRLCYPRTEAAALDPPRHVIVTQSSH